MPKKTKKEKLLALYHRKIRLLENKQTIISPVQTKVPTSILIPSPPQYFFSDLKKSLILITLIIGLEISLYFAKLIK
ncbi:hypothetical protein HZA75_05780 [Candidatus Roizmanbacteria bacterium]|nr:hypothetical protein [Candidatus Roizmanbacteria bacterium]